MDLRRPRSVRFRVTRLATAIVAFVLVGAGLVLVLVQHAALSTALDDALRLRADDLQTQIIGVLPDQLVGVDDDTAAQITSESGAVLVSSPNLTGPIQSADFSSSSETIRDIHLPGPDDSFRVLSRLVPSVQGPVVLHVATATDEVSDSVSVLRGSLLVVIPVTIAALAALVWVMAGRALQPVEELRREVDTISESDLSRRVVQPSTGDEVESLAVTMNLMLARLDGGVARLRQFVADASHELRGPLTRIRSEVEVDLADPASADPLATHHSVLDEARAMEDLVADLLFLARSDAGESPRRLEPVDLDDLLLEEAHRLQGEVAVDVSRVSAGQVVGDRSQLRRLVRNLASNAARYANRAVTFELSEVGESVVLRVSDDGPGIPAELHSAVFDRFTRTDTGRSRDDGGTGLGLAIARDIAERHGGSIRVDPDYQTGACLEVSFEV